MANTIKKEKGTTAAEINKKTGKGQKKVEEKKKTRSGKYDAYLRSDRHWTNKIRCLIRYVAAHPNDEVAKKRLSDLKREHPSAFRTANKQLTKYSIAV